MQPACADPAGQCADAFVAKLAPDGSLAYSSFLGRAGEDTANAIELDSAGDVYIAVPAKA